MFLTSMKRLVISTLLFVPLHTATMKSALAAPSFEYVLSSLEGDAMMFEPIYTPVINPDGGIGDSTSWAQPQLSSSGMESSEGAATFPGQVAFQLISELLDPNSPNQYDWNYYISTVTRLSAEIARLGNLTLNTQCKRSDAASTGVHGFVAYDESFSHYTWACDIDPAVCEESETLISYDGADASGLDDQSFVYAPLPPAKRVDLGTWEKEQLIQQVHEGKKDGDGVDLSSAPYRKVTYKVTVYTEGDKIKIEVKYTPSKDDEPYVATWSYTATFLPKDASGRTGTAASLIARPLESFEHNFKGEHFGWAGKLDEVDGTYESHEYKASLAKGEKVQPSKITKDEVETIGIAILLSESALKEGKLPEGITFPSKPKLGKISVSYAKDPAPKAPATKTEVKPDLIDFTPEKKPEQKK